MANIYVEHICKKLSQNYGQLERINKSLSLFKIISLNTLVYFRYSKINKNQKTPRAFYGLREGDILELEKYENSFICLSWDKLGDCIFIPFNNFISYFKEYPPSDDRQFKVLLFFKRTGTEFYLSKVGKFNVDAFYGISQLDNINQIDYRIPELQHNQVQTMVGAIGYEKNFNIWIPLKDRLELDYNLIHKLQVIDNLPSISKNVDRIAEELDVIWLNKNNRIQSVFEIEHTTPIYSGLLRINDVNLSVSAIKEYNIVAPSIRREKFASEINRPTFKYFHLDKIVTFIDYSSIYKWYQNILKNKNVSV